MALPSISALEECSDFSQTVAPFIPQLYALPERFAQVLAKRGGLVNLYLETNPLIFGFAVSLVVGAIVLVAAEVNRNYSQIDRLWSILPGVYMGHFSLWARLSGIPSARLDLAFAVGALWSIRLTFNYWRKGGYEVGTEDYRWEIIRKRIPAWLFHIFNWTFISFIQSILLFAFAAPVYVLLLTTQFEPNVTKADLAYFVVELGLILIETIADQQQWNFQSAKSQYRQSAKIPSGFHRADLDRGFISSGLWAYSRHPNFAAEQTVWFLVYQWSCFASNVLFNWSAAGATFLIMIFQGSTWLTEAITAGKYPDYADYQREVGRFVPKRLAAYVPPEVRRVEPRVIRTSELDKRMAKKQR